ncbi:MAG: hypothetical protein BGP16_14030 [Sphingobium sp. 66-54]|nr:MAG: hypothetical protein BGP16_14030 [Sphingobium sp. 66-54]
MRKIILSVAPVAAAVVLAMPANATVIDFDNLAGYTSGAYHEDGYVLSANFYHSATGRAIEAMAPGSSIDPTGISVVKASGAGVTFTLAREDGGAFEFGSMDFGKLKVETGPIYTASSTYKFIFTLADGVGTQVEKFFTFNHDRSTPITAHTAMFDGLGAITQFTFRGQSSPGQFDNIVLREIAPVPEPATWAMMIGGFALAGGALRRRRVALRMA